MIYRTFGKTGLKVSAIGMGCSGIGRSLYHRNDEESIKTLKEAFDLGINFFDTAPNYSGGDSERLISKALKVHREKIIITSKVGTTSTKIGKLSKKIKPLLYPVKNILNPIKKKLPTLYRSQRRHDFSREFIFKTVDESLKRLQTDYLDFLLLHHPTNEILESGDFCEVFEELKSKGKIRFYGASCDTVEQGILCLKHTGISSIQLELSILDQDSIEKFLPLAAKNNIAVVARLPLAKGLLSDSNSESKAERWAYDQKLLIERKAKVEKLKFLKIENRTLAQAALQFVLNLNGVQVALPGFNNRKHLKENLNTLKSPNLTEAELQKIDSIVLK